MPADPSAPYRASRPGFVTRADAADPDPPSSTDEPRVSGVRPYLLTGGRARSLDVTVQPEAQVLTTPDGQAALSQLTYEHREIVSLCVRPAAVVEIASYLRLHLGVVRILVADLVAAGYLTIRRREVVGVSQQVQIIERVIRALSAIR